MEEGAVVDVEMGVMEEKDASIVTTVLLEVTGMNLDSGSPTLPLIFLTATLVQDTSIDAVIFQTVVTESDTMEHHSSWNGISPLIPFQHYHGRSLALTKRQTLNSRIH